MREFILRIIKLLIRVGIINDVHVVRYEGSFFSLNDLYSQGHWSKRSKLKSKYTEIFRYLCHSQNVRPFERFYLIVMYSSNHDIDNVVGMEKVFVDSLKGIYVHDDSKEYYKGMLILPNKGLPHNVIDFIILTTNGKQD